MDIDYLKNKFKNTLHYQTQVENLFKDYINSLFPKDYKENNIKNSNFDYQPLNKNIYFMTELLSTKDEFSICYININISLKNDKISYSFEESKSNYNEDYFLYKKYLFESLYNLINSISIDKLNSIFEQYKIIKKEYLELEREIKKLEEEYYYSKFKKYQLAIYNMFERPNEKEIDNLVEEYIEQATQDLYLKKPDFDYLQEPVFNVFREKHKIVYFQFDKDQVELCEGNIDFNFDKNKNIKYKINDQVISKKKFILALSNQFHIEGKLVTDLEEVFKNPFFQIFIDKTFSNFPNKYRLKKVNIEDFTKPFIINSMANNF